MKLKKIASLALAGAMAVSMLAGCANKAPETNDGEGQGEVETTATISDVLNQAQTGDAKVAFSDSVALNAALQSVLISNGININRVDLMQDVSGLLNVSDSKAQFGSFQFGFKGKDYELNGLLNDTMNYYWGTKSFATGVDTAKAAGTYTTVNYQEFTGYSSQEAAEKAIAKYMDGILSKLSTHSAMTKNPDYVSGTIADADKLEHGTENDTYYTYSYTGNAALVTINKADGTTTYGLFYIINQTVAEATI